ncbi:hypothetical protein R1flu_012600 [Riccia fluitans]|uniref:Uncharacterized protein n=1 Tax=Riccia fluitans TaxID=41844 RepID=A0ABD1ZB36_9MARC
MPPAKHRVARSREDCLLRQLVSVDSEEDECEFFQSLTDEATGSGASDCLWACVFVSDSFGAGNCCHRRRMASNRAAVENSVASIYQLSNFRPPSSAGQKQIDRVQLTESCEDMAFSAGAMDRTSSVRALEVPSELLRALTGKQSEEDSANITHLPGVLVGAILSRISSPIEVASAFMASRIFWSVAQTTPFRLKLRPSRSGYDALESATWIRSVLGGISRTMGGTQELDLSECSVLDEDVAELLVNLFNLEHLILDGCQKLTSSVADALSASVSSGPRALSLQRCFRLGPAAAGNLLTSATSVGSRLQTLLLSHLDRIDLPQDPPLLESSDDGTEKESSVDVELVKNVVSKVPSSSLRILALHKCGNLGASELSAIAGACPYLEIWMLGGSTEGLGLSRYDVVSLEKGLSRSDLVSVEKVVMASSALLQAAKLLSRLRILEITFFSTPVLSAVRAQISPGICVWDFCDKNSVTAAARLVAHLKECSMPSVGKECAALSAEEVPFRDWCIDVFGEESVSGNQIVEQYAFVKRQEPSGEYGVGARWDVSTSDMLLSLKASTNCSDFRRRTPLHIASARGDADIVVKLLFIGASARKMKDSGGATALFQAAENGHAEVCKLLLRGGADVLSSNRTGETPLYIAALRGHSAAVKVMLAHCHEQGIDWQDPHVYGDGWTPLMAATVAGRQDVAEVILDFALTSSAAPEEALASGVELISTSDGSLTGEMVRTSIEKPSFGINNKSLGPRRIFAPRLVDAQNRYGQTALHIAAKCKASTWFVDQLLHAGASVDVKDEYGYRPIDVARKLQHVTMEETLRKWQQIHGKSTGVSGTSERPGRKKKAKQKKAAAELDQMSDPDLPARLPSVQIVLLLGVKITALLHRCTSTIDRRLEARSSTQSTSLSREPEKRERPLGSLLSI